MISDSSQSEISPRPRPVTSVDSQRSTYYKRSIKDLAKKINDLSPRDRKRVFKIFKETFYENEDDMLRIQKMNKPWGFDDHTRPNGPDIATAFDEETCKELEVRYSKYYKFVTLSRELILKTKVAKNICIKQYSKSF